MKERDRVEDSYRDPGLVGLDEVQAFAASRQFSTYEKAAARGNAQARATLKNFPK